MDHREFDGLNSLKYKLLTLDKRRLYTWVYVALNESDYSVPFSSLSSKNSSLPFTLHLYMVAIVTLICLNVS